MTLTTNEHHVLLVDDDPNVLLVYRRALQIKGYRVMTAAGGASAISHMKSTCFDLVVTDLEMPGTDGRVVLQKAKELNPQQPVMIMTGNHCVDSLNNTFRHHADAYMLKSCPLHDFWQQVADCIQKGKEENIAKDEGGLF